MISASRYSVFVAALFLFAFTTANISTAQLSTKQQTAYIGVLAFRGTSAAQLRWLPLVDYLNESIAGWRFEIVPVTLASVPRQIAARKIDFLITNPGHYVELQKKYRLSTLATRERRIRNSGAGVLEFGTAIIARKNANIRTLGDLKNKRVAAVSPNAFGGFQMAWYEMLREKIDPFADLKSLQFMGFPQDAIVEAVRSGRVDVGIVRSGLLELLASEGKLDISDFHVLQTNNQINYPHMISSSLYPEWPFAALSATDKQLRENVSIALLSSQNSEISGKFKLHDLWSAPLSYEDARALVTAYKKRGIDTDSTHISGIPNWVVAALMVLLSLALLTAILQIGRRRQNPRSAHSRTGTNIIPDEEAKLLLGRFDSLTRREREILCMICNGFSSKIIADDLGISTKTVEFHRANLLQKTKAGTTPQLVQLATRLGYDGADLQ